MILTILIKILILITLITKMNRQFQINDQLLLETILFSIRGETMKYSSFKKKQSIEQESKLEMEIKHTEERIQTNLNTTRVISEVM